MTDQQIADSLSEAQKRVMVEINGNPVLFVFEKGWRHRWRDPSEARVPSHETLRVLSIRRLIARESTGEGIHGVETCTLTPLGRKVAAIVKEME